MMGDGVLLRDRSATAQSEACRTRVSFTVLGGVGAVSWRLAVSGSCRLRRWLVAAGGNFGVATSFEYRLHKVGPLVIGELTAFPFGAAWGPSRGPRRSSRQQTVYRCTTADPQSINPAPIMPLSGQHPWIGHRALNYPEFGVLAVCSCVYPRQPLPADGNPADRPRDPGADPSPWFGRW